MKKIFTILSGLLFSTVIFCQTFPQKTIQGSATTLTDNKGAISVSIGLINAAYTDTSAVNLNPYIKNYPGAEIYTTSDNSKWLRNSVASAWLKIGPSTGGSLVSLGSGTPIGIMGSSNVRSFLAYNGTSSDTLSGVIRSALGGSDLSFYTTIGLNGFPLNITHNAVNNSAQSDSNALTLTNRSLMTTSTDTMVTPSLRWLVQARKQSGGQSSVPMTFTLDAYGRFGGLGFATLQLKSRVNTAAPTIINTFDQQGRFTAYSFNKALITSSGSSAGNNLKISTDDGDVAMSTSAIQNIAIGLGVMTGDPNTAARDNVFVGYGAGANNDTSDNVGIGNYALNQNVSGHANTAVGRSALFANISGIKISAVGGGAFENNTTGGFGSVVGEDGFLHNTTGINNTGMGWLVYGLNQTGSNNTVLGWHALVEVANGSNNVGVGSNITSTEDTVDNVLALGTSAIVSASNQIIIGNSSHTQVKLYGPTNNTNSAALTVALLDTVTNRVYHAPMSSIVGAVPILQHVLNAGSFITTTSNIKIDAAIALNFTQDPGGSGFAFRYDLTDTVLLMLDRAIYMPSLLRSSAARNVMVVIDSLTGLAAYQTIPSVPTWEQTLDVTNGSSVTEDHTITIAADKVFQFETSGTGAFLVTMGGANRIALGSLATQILSPNVSERFSVDNTGHYAIGLNAGTTNTRIVGIDSDDDQMGYLTAGYGILIGSGNVRADTATLFSAVRVTIPAATSYTFSTGLTNTANTITNNLSTGVSGGQTAIGGTASGNALTLSSTSNATKGKILFGTSGYDEVNNRLGIGNSAPGNTLEVTGTAQAVAFQTLAVAANANFATSSSGGTSNQTTAPLLLPGGTGTGLRIFTNGTTATTQTAGSDYGQEVSGAGLFTEAASSTHPRGFGLAVLSPTVTNGAGATDTLVGLYVQGPPTGITPAAGSWNTIFNRGDIYVKYGEIRIGTPVGSATFDSLAYMEAGRIRFGSSSSLTGLPYWPLGGNGNQSAAITITGNGDDITVGDNTVSQLFLSSGDGFSELGDAHDLTTGTKLKVDVNNNIITADNTAHTALVGINKATPTANFEVWGTGGGQGLQVDVTNALYGLGNINGTNNSTNIIIIDDGSTPTAYQAAGGHNFNGGRMQIADLTGGGVVNADGSGTLFVVSDGRFKNILGTYEVGLDGILKLNPALYKWNELSGLEQNGTYVGLIAQNVEEALGSYAVGHNKKGYLTLNDRAITAALVNGEKELYQMIIDLKKEFDDYKKTHP